MEPRDKQHPGRELTTDEADATQGGGELPTPIDGPDDPLGGATPGDSPFVDWSNP